jgi:Na+/melibiose symporter-like transporter
MSSHGFSHQLEPVALKRSLLFSAAASGFGSIFFTIVQGTVFQFFLEEMSLRDRLPLFMALWCLGGLGSLIGSWIIRRTGRRKLIFFLGCGLSRVMWLGIGLIPLLKPEWAKGDAAFAWLTVAIFIFYFWHSIGAVSWMSWMGDLVPLEQQGRYWSLRQVWTSFTAVPARIATGYYLELHNNFDAFAVVFGCTVVIGVIDACFFIPVEHRPPPVTQEKSHIFREFAARLREGPFRTLCLVYILWSISNALVGPTAFFFMRDTIHLGVGYISAVEGFALVWLTIFSLLWGRYVDLHGYRAPLVLCILLQATGLVFYFFAREGDLALILLTTVLTSIGFCGTQLFMMPLIMRYARQQDGSRDAGIAAFSVGLAVAQAAVLIVADRHIFEWIGTLLTAKPYSTPVYMLMFAGIMGLRFFVAWLAWTLPREEKETSLSVVLSEAFAANPLQASWRAIKYGGSKNERKDEEIR